MKNIYLLALVATTCFFACSSADKTEESSDQSTNEWELQIMDSIQVDYLGNISTGDFKDGLGLLYDNTSNSIIKIDYDGKVLETQAYPKEGPNSISHINTVKFDPHGNPYIGYFRGDYYELNEDLSIRRNIEMPFQSQSFGGLMDGKSFGFWEDKIIFHFPGRDEVSPYTETYLRDNFLLEKLNPSTGESSPLIRTPETSKFSSGLLYERPSISIEISENDLLLYFDNEPKIHKYSLLDSGRFVETIDIQSKNFIQSPELKDKTERYSYERLVEGNIYGVFADKDQFVVHYSEGISEDVFSAQEFTFPEDFPKLIELNQSNFKIYDTKKGWSNEIPIPKKVDNIFAMDSPTQPFFALRNDEYLGEEQEYLTFYKLQLVQK